MNGFYNFFIFMFILGAAGGAINELHIFGMNVPTQTVRINEATVRDFQNGSLSQAPSEFNVWEIVFAFMRVVGSGITGMFLIGLTFYDLWTMAGGDVAIGLVFGAVIQAPATLITFFGVYEWWTGRSLT